jgi:hypothetical protein
MKLDIKVDRHLSNLYQFPVYRSKYWFQYNLIKSEYIGSTKCPNYGLVLEIPQSGIMLFRLFAIFRISIQLKMIAISRRLMKRQNYTLYFVYPNIYEPHLIFQRDKRTNAYVKKCFIISNSTANKVISVVELITGINPTVGGLVTVYRGR